MEDLTESLHENQSRGGFAAPDEPGQEGEPGRSLADRSSEPDAAHAETDGEGLTGEHPGEPSDSPDAANPPAEDALPADADTSAASDLSDSEAMGVVEAILFATENALPLSRIAQVGEMPQRTVRKAIRLLNERYEQTATAFRIEEIAGGYQMQTLAQYHDVLSRLLKVKSETKLSQAAMETLAIVAYRQPIIRADVESIRGVACGEMIRMLMEKQLVKIVGRAEVLGRPMLYGTTRRFLETFGLGSLDDLPKVEELRAPAYDPAKAPKAPPAEGQPAAAAAPLSTEPPAEPATTEPSGSGEPPAEPPPPADDAGDNAQAQ